MINTGAISNQSNQIIPANKEPKYYDFLINDIDYIDIF